MNEYMKMADRMYNLDNQFEQLKKKNEKLEKENAELKARLNAINLLTPELEKLSKLKTQQLTKAADFLKGVIEVFVTAPTQFSERQKKDLFEDIEQFLSEVEK